jgi:dihydrofolate reductase
MPEKRVFADISVSLDGFITGPDPSPGQGLGEGGERLHQWIFDLASWRRPHGLEGGSTGPDDDLMGEAFARAGAFVVGRRMFDHAEGWGDEPPFHKRVFVLTHEPREPLEKQGGTIFTFVNDGIESAVRRAREAAGDKDVSIAGGANVIQQAWKARLLDEIQIHLVPILLGGGVRLLEHVGTGGAELEKTRVIDSSGVTHLRFRIPK